MKLRLQYKPDLVAALVRTSGVLALLSVSLRSFPIRFFSWLPFDPTRSAHVTELISGLALIYLASQLHRKKYSALIATSCLLGLLILIESLHSRHPHFILAATFAAILFVLLLQRGQYVVRNDATSLRRNWLIAGGLLLAVAGFVLITFARIDQNDYGRRLTTSQTFSITVKAVTGSPLPAHLSTRRGRDLIFSLQAALVLSGTIAAFGLFAPIRMRVGSSRYSRQLAEAILHRFSTSSEDYLKLWPADKHYYFYNDSFVAYGVSRGVAVVLDGATGDSRYFGRLRRNFMQECRINGWQVTVLHADENEKRAWEKVGMHEQYIGSEARVSIDDFCLNKARDKHFRYIRNRAEKDGLSVIELARPLSETQLGELQAVSEAWLSGGKREYSFIMGYFDAGYLRRSRIFAVLQAGHIVAYTNLLPTYQDANLSIDQMRSLSDVSTSTMHYLLMNVILGLQGTAAATLNLGLAPLSKVEDNVRRLQQPVMAAIKMLGDRYYSFSGLEQFKGKFSPDWEQTYILYSGLPTKLAPIGAAIMSLSTYQQSDRRRRILWTVLILSALSGLGYAAFPLAIILNPAYAWHGMVSILGQAGQPYANVFNNIDDISSSLAILIAAGLLIRLRHLSRLLRWALYSVLISNIGNILAAVFILPLGVDIDGQWKLKLLENPSILAHGSASLANSAGFMAAVILWAIWTYRQSGWNRRHVLTVAIVALSTIGFVVGQLFAATAPTIQRAFIVSYGLWFVVFCYDVLQTRRDTKAN